MSLVTELKKALEEIEKIDSIIERTKTHQENHKREGLIAKITYWSGGTNNKFEIEDEFLGFERTSGIIDDLFQLYFLGLTDKRAELKETYMTLMVRNNAL